MTGGTVHVVGAGLAGLACAVELARRGRRTVLYEAAGQAGGRCRSLDDAVVGGRIDNGNHFLLAANREAVGYVEAIGAAHTLVGPAETAFPFVDLRDGRRWCLRPNPGRLPWWVLDPARRVPRTRARDYLAGWRLARAGDDARVSDCLDRSGPLWETFWDPLTTAVLNTAPAEASARLLWTTLAATFLKGGAACRPLLARHSLAASFVDPALALLARAGVPVRFRARLRRVVETRGRVVRLAFGDTAEVELGDADRVVLALPPQVAQALLPRLVAPMESRPIVNAHFRLDRAPTPDTTPRLLGLVGGVAQWLVVRGPMVSITVSAATALVDLSAERLAELLWADTARALDLNPVPPLPPWRIIKERRATFAQTPPVARQRPPARTHLANLLLAGDWTDTGLPATIEGAVRSGKAAAFAAA